MVLSRLNHKTDPHKLNTANATSEMYTTTKFAVVIVPAMISFVASVTFSTGMMAVLKFNDIPGTIPIAAGTITAILSGVIRVCASLKDLADNDTDSRIPAKKTVSGNSKLKISSTVSTPSILTIMSNISGGSSLDWRSPI